MLVLLVLLVLLVSSSAGAACASRGRLVLPVTAIIAEVSEISTVQQLALLASIEDLAFDKPPTAGRKLFCQAAINEARKRHNMTPVTTATAAAQAPPESSAAVNAAYALSFALACLHPHLQEHLIISGIV